MSHDFHSLKVSQVKKETADAVTLTFDVPDHLIENFSFQAGQYLTLKFQLKEKEERRAYSICSSPIENKLSVNVKRVAKGLVSNHINDHVKVGDEIEVMSPDGNFKIDFHSDLGRDFYFFAAGSGITPIISIIKTALEEEPKSKCHLLYGNKSEKSVIFKEELAELEEKYRGQFVLKETLSSPERQKEGGLKGLFSRGKESWTGWKGRIDGKKIDQFLEDNPSSTQDTHYFVCGPGAMIDTIIDHLETKNINPDHLHKEHFVSSTPAGAGGAEGVSSEVKVHLSGKSFSVQVSPDKTILDALIDEKYDPPYSCTSGACSTCIAKLISGSVTMDACYALDDDEVKDGFILVCQSRAQTENVELTFDT